MKISITILFLLTGINAAVALIGQFTPDSDPNEIFQASLLFVLCFGFAAITEAISKSRP